MAQDESTAYCRPASFEDLKSVIRCLNEQEVDYVLIGGYALQAHGYYRATTDIDILVPPTKEQGEKVKNALLVLPDRAARDIDPAWFLEGETIRVADEFVIDILFNAGGETLDRLRPFVETLSVDGLPIKTLSLEGLVLTKQGVREKDVLDRNLLEQALAILQKGNKAS